jgi:hypothetical protein
MVLVNEGVEELSEDPIQGHDCFPLGAGLSVEIWPESMPRAGVGSRGGKALDEDIAGQPLQGATSRWPGCYAMERLGVKERRKEDHGER